jgi:hypothetical protein
MEIDQDDNPPDPLQRVLVLVLALLGLVLIGFGIWALAGAVFAAWELFNNPDSIGYFARYFLETTKIAAHLESGGEGLAHLLSWLAVVLLLLVLGKLGAWSITAAASLIQIGRNR